MHIFIHIHTFIPVFFCHNKHKWHFFMKKTQIKTKLIVSDQQKNT